METVDEEYAIGVKEGKITIQVSIKMLLAFGHRSTNCDAARQC